MKVFQLRKLAQPKTKPFKHEFCATHKTVDIKQIFLESLHRLGIIFLFALKGFVAYSLWMEKDWAVQIAEIDAYLSVVICVLSMIFFPFSETENGYSFKLRIELLLIIPYLLKLRKIKPVW